MSVNSNPEAKFSISLTSTPRSATPRSTRWSCWSTSAWSFKATELEKALIGIWKPAWNKTRLSTELLVSAVVKKLTVMLAHSRYIPSRRELLQQKLPLERHAEFQEPG